MYSDFIAAMVFGFDFDFLTVWSYKICQKLKIEAKIHSGFEIRIHYISLICFKIIIGLSPPAITVLVQHQYIKNLLLGQLAFSRNR
jgi:hypothetical protein